jgi:hypothetical protein
MPEADGIPRGGGRPRLFSAAEEAHAERIAAIEVCRDEESCSRHVAFSHFQRCRLGTLRMVKSLELAGDVPLVPETLIKPIRP